MKQSARKLWLNWGLPLMGLVVAVLAVSCAQKSPRTAGLPFRPGSDEAPGRRGFAEAFRTPMATGHMMGVEASGRAPVPVIPYNEDELWVISRRSPEHFHHEAEDQPGSGALMTRIAQREVPVPLKHTEVHAGISGHIATVDVEQQFQNPYDQKIEALYLFPLPQNAAVTEFVMQLGDRRIRGIIREREEAEEIYRAAKRQGHVASLLTQERPNLFKQAVANIEPGREIEVKIRYFHTLAFDDGWFEFVFPMVVGPRFNPPQMVEGVGAVARGQEGRSSQSTEVSYLRPRERSGHDIALALEIDAGMKVEEIQCKTHVVETTRLAPDRMTVELEASDSIPNRDFVFRYRLGGAEVKSGFITAREKGDGYFNLLLIPPRILEGRWRQPLELVFVLDCSGSMSGEPMAQSKAAVDRALDRLERGDSFQIIRFSSTSSSLGPRSLAATPANVARGRRYLRDLKSGGGTMMIEGIKAALDFPHDPERLRFVCFLTDGYIGNETDILGEVHRRLGESRIFSFGVGSSPNRFLLDRMAKLGRGTVAYLGLKEDGGAVMDRFFDQVSHPALTDMRIDWGGMRVDEVYPREIPDLFSGRPVILSGRFKGEGQETIRVKGKIGGDRVELKLTVDLEHTGSHPALPKLWARKKIIDLADQATHSLNLFLAGQIRNVALNYGLMSAYTSFVAVDSSQRTAGRSGVTVPVPVPVPDGVRYETTVE